MTPQRAVIAERRRRGLSVRAAASLGAVSNTTWSNFEASAGPPSPRMRAAVTEAFGWPSGWVENVPAAVDTDELSRLRDRVRVLEEAVELLLDREIERRHAETDDAQPIVRARRAIGAG